MRKIRVVIAAAFVLAISLADITAQVPPVQSQYQQGRFIRQDVMIPMRDGVRLQTVIFIPKQSKDPLPILLRRSPYGVPDSEPGQHSVVYEDLITDGYIFAYQNI